MFDQKDVFEHLLEANPLLFFAYQVSTAEVLYVNEAYERLLAPARRATATQDLPWLLSCLPAEDREYTLSCLRELAAGELHDELVLRVQTDPAAPRRWLRLRAYRTTRADGEVLLCGTVEDVTAEHEYARTTDTFLAGRNSTMEILAHDLAGPFNMLQQLAGYFQEKTQDLNDPQLSKMLQVMKDTCRGGVSLIREFMESEAAGSASLQLDRRPVELVALLRQLVAEWQVAEGSAAHRFEFTSTAENVLVELDPAKLRQALDHLLSNAVKFTKEGGRIALRLELQPGQVLLTVADDGVGIPERFHPVLFDRFTKARRPGLRGEKTTGLGMAIAHALVELHGGRIWFESQENAGTTFYVQLPTRGPA